MKERLQQQKYNNNNEGETASATHNENGQQTFNSHSPTPQRHSGKKNGTNFVSTNVKMQIGKKQNNNKVVN